MRIETERLVIRLFQADDFLDFLTLIADREASPMAIYDYPFPTSLPEQSAMFSYVCSQPDWSAIALKQKNFLIGAIRLFAKDDETSTLELGYFIRSTYHRQGIATEAGRAVLDWLRTETDTVTITARAAELNVPSLGVMRKLGFVEVGRRPMSFRTNDAGEPIEHAGIDFRLNLRD